MDREKAFEELKLRIESQDIIRHCLAVEAIMKSLAKHFHEDAEIWGMTGLVHDIDWERIDGNMELHGKMGGDILENLDFDQTVVYAVRAHNPANRIARRRKLDKALYFASPMAELIMACVESTPGKAIDGIDAERIMQCYADPEFQPKICRDRIDSCGELDLSVEELAEISLKALKETL
ncbi:MAG: HDIG domain-containing protein [Clostridiaceae bacterium]|nr:HDIG domain-containing protein [Bacillota bacterium]NLI38267.1 HDIG domain-containing protein [Clostridiaceae bacterium]